MTCCIRITKGGGSVTPLKNHKNIGFLSNTGPDPLNDCKGTKSAFNVRPPSARQWTDGGQILVLFGSSPPHQTKRECSGSVVECLTRGRGAAGLSLTALWSLSKTHLS